MLEFVEFWALGISKQKINRQKVSILFWTFWKEAAAKSFILGHNNHKTVQEVPKGGFCYGLLCVCVFLFLRFIWMFSVFDVVVATVRKDRDDLVIVSHRVSFVMQPGFKVAASASRSRRRPQSSCRMFSTILLRIETKLVWTAWCDVWTDFHVTLRSCVVDKRNLLHLHQTLQRNFESLCCRKLLQWVVH